MNRICYRVGEINLVEPTTEDEYNRLLDELHPDERGEMEDAHADREDALEIFRSFRRKVTIYHLGTLLGVGEMFDREDGTRFVSLERTTHALEVGHRFTWLRHFKRLVEWFLDTDAKQGYKGDVFTATPTNLPRALDVYGKYASAKVVSTIDFRGREYWILKIERG